MPSMLLSMYCRVAVAMQVRARDHAERERGQATVEYVLVLLGAAGIALLLLAAVAKSDKVGQLLDAVFDSVVGKVT